MSVVVRVTRTGCGSGLHVRRCVRCGSWVRVASGVEQPSGITVGTKMEFGVSSMVTKVVGVKDERCLPHLKSNSKHFFTVPRWEERDVHPASDRTQGWQ